MKDSLLGKAVGLMLLGAAVGACISLIVVLLARAWLEVTSGKLKGMEFVLDKFMRARGPAIAIALNGGYQSDGRRAAASRLDARRYVIVR